MLSHFTLTTKSIYEYPPIIDVLQEMDQTMPLLNMPQYEAALIEHGIAYVNAVVGISNQLFVDVIGMLLVLSDHSSMLCVASSNMQTKVKDGPRSMILIQTRRMMNSTVRGCRAKNCDRA